MLSRKGLPPGPAITPWLAWACIYHPKRLYAHLRARYGDVATIFSPDRPFVLALRPDGARQVLTANPNNYVAFGVRTFYRAGR